MRRRWVGAGVLLLALGTGARAAEWVTTEAIKPDPKPSVLVPAARLSAAELEALHTRYFENRERTAAGANNHPPSPPGLPAPYSEPTAIVGATPEFHGNPDDFEIGRNVQNPFANGAGESTVAEPTAINDGAHLYYTGNWHQEYSDDGGTTWTSVAFPSGPSDAPNFCCDQDTVYDQGRGVTFHTYLYINTSATNGVVTTAIRRNVDSADNCTYTWDPGGSADNILPDYPHLGVSGKYLYMTANLIQNGTTWVRSVVRRINIDQMADCTTAGVTTWSYSSGGTGQRVFVPAEGLGQRDRMYWALLENSTQIRVYRWLESASAPTNYLRSISSSSFTDSDCRGGTNNTDWIESSTSYSITGFRVRGALGWHSYAGSLIGFWWNVGHDNTHAEQAHIHFATFTEPSITLASQGALYNAESCFGYPAVAANERGDFGVSLAIGGAAGGGGQAVQGYVGISDEYSGPGSPGRLGTVYIVASGTHNPPNTGSAANRWGDYFTVRPQEPCDLFFAATNYALDGGSAASNVNARYVEFGRGRDQKCYNGWRDAVRTP